MRSKSDKFAESFDHCHYVPCLRWKQGEYQALLRLRARTKDRITPLIEVPELGWDFETRTAAKTPDQHLPPFAERVRAKWGTGACFVDLKLLGSGARLADGTHPLDFVLAELHRSGCGHIPVTALDRDIEYQRAVREAASRDRHGVCLRLSLSQAAKSDTKKNVDSLLETLKASSTETDLVLDLDAPNFVPLDGFSKLLRTIILRLPHLDEWRTLTVIGTSFPRTMAGLPLGPQLVHRQEWLLYKRLVRGLLAGGNRLPTFGDYGIAHPEVLRLDMRRVKPAASIRYTVDDGWYILKGPNVRKHGFGQYRGLCKGLISEAWFAGRSFSEGDAYIQDCAVGRARTGNLTTWRWVGTNHHIEKVVADVASLFGSSRTT